MSHVPTPLLLELATAIEDHLGLELKDNRLADMSRMLDRIHDELQFASSRTCAEWLAHHPWTERQTSLVAQHMTIGETYFYRDTVLMRLLEEEILPTLIKSKAMSDRTLRIWSVGCSTGEEPYMLAMLLDRVLPDQSGWKIHLLATDINEESLAKARAGIYREWAFRQAPPWLKNEYFKELEAGVYELRPQIRRQVTFTRLNLSKPGYPSLLNDTHNMDLLICRNVLMYFSASTRAEIVGRLRQSLSEGGWLLGSPSEAGAGCFTTFQVEHRHGRSLYRKADPLAGEAWTPPRAAAFEVPILRRRTVKPQRPPATPPTRPAALPRPLPNEPDLLAEARQQAGVGKFEQALDAIRNAIELDKLDANAYYLRATIQEEQGDMDAAHKGFQQALYLDPEFIMAHVALAGLLQRRGQEAVAARHWRNAERLLANMDSQATIPESEGLTVQELRQQLTMMAGGALRG